MATIPGSLFRKILFWLHLCCGVAAGLVILTLSVTGALLSYEHQLTEAAGAKNRITLTGGETALGADVLAGRARAAAPEARRANLVFNADPAEPVSLTRGREAPPILLNPYTGAVIEDAAAGRRSTLRTVESLHRWLGGTGSSVRASVVDVANLFFLVMIVSGFYLWLPAVWRWRTVSALTLFRRRYVTTKMRDFAWHHVFAFWMFIPLLVIAFSGVVMSYGWANSLVYRAFGEAPPQRRAPNEAAEGGRREGRDGGEKREAGARTSASLDALLAAAKSQVPNWQRITLPAAVRGERVEVVVESKSDAQRLPRTTLVLAAADAAVLSVTPPATPSAGQRARIWLRFAHTGEAYGLIGQTIGFLACIAACFLVYTGLALAWRRLITPLLRRAAPVASGAGAPLSSVQRPFSDT